MFRIVTLILVLVALGGCSSNDDSSSSTLPPSASWWLGDTDEETGDATFLVKARGEKFGLPMTDEHLKRLNAKFTEDDLINGRFEWIKTSVGH